MSILYTNFMPHKVESIIRHEIVPDAVSDKCNLKFTPEMKGKVPLFLLRGGLNYPKMKPLDRLLMYLVVRSKRSLDPAAMDEDTKGLIATYGKTVDFTNRKTIAPVIECIADGY